MPEWCENCGNTNPFALLKTLRLTAVLLALTVAVVMALLAYRHTNQPGNHSKGSGGSGPYGVRMVRQPGAS